MCVLFVDGRKAKNYQDCESRAFNIDRTKWRGELAEDGNSDKVLLSRRHAGLATGLAARYQKLMYQRSLCRDAARPSKRRIIHHFTDWKLALLMD